MATISDKLAQVHSLRWRLAASFLALSVVPLLIFNFTVINFIQDYYMTERTREANTRAIQMSGLVAMHGLDNLQEAQVLARLRQQVEERARDWDVRIFAIDDAAIVIEDSHRNRVGHPWVSPEVLAALGGSDTTDLRRGEYTLHTAVSVHDVASGRTGAVLIITPVYDIFQSVDQLREMLFLFSLAVGLMVVVLTFVFAHQLIAPLRRVLAVVRRMATGQLSLRIPVVGRHEYAALSTAFNDMAAKLEQVDRTREEFVSNVSHELKTPLAAMKVLSESILLQENVPVETCIEFMRDINTEIDRMHTLTNDLLALVKVDQGEQALNLHTTDLNQLVEDILRRLAPLAEQKKVVLLYEEVRPISMPADEIKLALAISNIVENGIKYTPRGGTVKVAVNAAGQQAIITIKDTGVGIPHEEQDKIFNRFYRVDKTRDRDTGGTGLGLAISKSTVILHGGTIAVDSSPENGSLFTIRIPIRT